MKIISAEQYTDEWYQARLGVPSASCFDDIITATGKPSKSAEKYLFKLAGEKVSGKAEETYQNEAMKRGTLLEDEARQLYQIITDTTVEKVGFCIHDEINSGASPDGLVGDDGLIEIKCPSISVHVEYLLNNELPSKYYQQTQGQLFITGRKWNDFVSFYPGLKPLIVRVYPDKEFHAALEAELKSFCKKLEETINRIK